MMLFTIDVDDLPEGKTDLVDFEDLPKEAGLPGRSEDTITLKVADNNRMVVELWLAKKGISFDTEMLS